MFGLLHNLYKYLRKKAERKITFVILGLDNAGKTTLLNTIQGELDKETAPSFGFSSSTINEGKYKIDVYDLGGGKSIRRIWKTYFAEVHGIMFVIDAADSARFSEAKEVLGQTFDEAHLRNKPVLVFANKQDVPAAASASQVAQEVGLSSLPNSYNIMPCTAKTPPGQQPDTRVKEGFRWLVSSVDHVFPKLDIRVQKEADEVKQEELRKKKERDERVRRMKEERLRKQQEQEAGHVEQKQNALSTLPNQIESPGKYPPPVPMGSGLAPSPPVEFSDLRKPDGQHAATGMVADGAREGLASGPHTSLLGSLKATASFRAPAASDTVSIQHEQASQRTSGIQATHSQEGGLTRKLSLPPHNKVAPVGELS